ncbi:MAG: YajQ family cyclic di-GMP-binding protein [Gammaproteobacteria bacterium]|nr:YajQ family cyclic di-GMP-binding protein [Gammaproteobacteria bacterium]
MPSFDVVSELDKHEVKNAVDQAGRELSNRFDFKGVDAGFELKDNVVTMRAPSDFQLAQMRQILDNTFARRGIDIKCISVAEPQVAIHEARQDLTLREGLETPLAKQMVKQLKTSKLKVQAAIQGAQLRVSGKKRDDLQSAMALLKDGGYDMPLQFTNFRD